MMLYCINWHFSHCILVYNQLFYFNFYSGGWTILNVYNLYFLNCYDIWDYIFVRWVNYIERLLGFFGMVYVFSELLWCMAYFFWWVNYLVLYLTSTVFFGLYIFKIAMMYGIIFFPVGMFLNVCDVKDAIYILARWEQMGVITIKINQRQTSWQLFTSPIHKSKHFITFYYIRIKRLTILAVNFYSSKAVCACQYLVNSCFI